MLAPGMIGASMVAVYSTTRFGAVVVVSSLYPAAAMSSASAEVHMPCTITLGRPARCAAVSETWMGLRSPETSAKDSMLSGAVTVVKARNDRGVSITLGNAEELVRAVLVPRRPRMAKRSDRVARRVPSASISARTRMRRPMLVSFTSSVCAVMVSSAVPSGRVSASLMWCSRCTRLSMPSTTESPSVPGITAFRTAAKMAGQACPTSTSGAVPLAVRLVGRNAAVTLL